MNASACEVCGTVAGGPADRSRARWCHGCGRDHVVCAGCGERFGIAAPARGFGPTGPLRECPDGARAMYELMGPPDPGAGIAWRAILEASDDRGAWRQAQADAGRDDPIAQILWNETRA